MVGRRGMSPLIATVLLMAFAVALGGMIMNLTSGGDSEGDCSLVKVTVTELCLKQNALQLRMTNLPESVALNGVDLRINSAGYDSTIGIKDSALKPGEALEKLLPVVASSTSRADVLAQVGSTHCTQPLWTKDPLPLC